MAETYKKIYPGNFVTRLNAWAAPNDDFVANGRASGDPRDRKQQGLLVFPGWVAVRKVGAALITTGAKSWDFTILSPDLRPDDKPRADITGLFVPSGSAIYRMGFRVTPVNAQPGFSSQGFRGDADTLGSGLAGTATDLLAMSSAAIATKAVGSFSATAARTSSDNASVSDPARVVVGAGGTIAPASQMVMTTFGAPQVTTADLTLKLYSVAAAGNVAGSDIRSTLTGGVYVVGEVCYLVPETVVDLEELSVPGSRYAGFQG